MDNIMMLILGLFISVLGLVNMTGNISSIHSYNRKNVKEEDIPKYGKVVGIGTLIIGVSFVVQYVLMQLGLDTLAGIAAIAALVIGIGFLLYGQFKYNKGIF